MKKIFLSLSAILFVINYSFAQTNTFPLTGSVGIGTLSPTHTLTLADGSTGIVSYNTSDQTTNYQRAIQYWSGTGSSAVYNVLTQGGGSASSGAMVIGDIYGRGIAINTNTGTPMVRTTSAVLSSGTARIYQIDGTSDNTATGNPYGLGIFWDVNQASSSSGSTSLFISSYQPSIGSGKHYLIDAGINSGAVASGTHTSKFTVDNGGNGFFNGNVGIGTSSPAATLDVVGNIGIPSGNIFGRTDLSINQYTDVSNYFFYGLERIANSGRFSGMKVYNIQNVAGYPASRIGFLTDNTQFSYSTEWMTINEWGNVGVGTTSPVNKLDVQGGNASVYNTGTTSGLTVGSNATGKTYIGLSTSADASGYGILQSISASGSTYGNTVINPSAGNVLIGKTSQLNTGYILDVAGYARANEIVVNTTGADFVFAPSYKLNSLSSLEKYIDKNHHLPEMPSAKEMQENGLSVGENQTKLLQKVEELTLYLIEKDKQLKTQQQEIDELKKQVSTLIKPKS